MNLSQNEYGWLLAPWAPLVSAPGEVCFLCSHTLLPADLVSEVPVYSITITPQSCLLVTILRLSRLAFGVFLNSAITFSGHLFGSCQQMVYLILLQASY